MTVRLSEPLTRLAESWNASELFSDDEQTAATYARGMHGRPLTYYVRRVHNLGLQGVSVLDAGGGTGTWSFALAPFFRSVISLDRNQGRVRLAWRLARKFGVPNVHVFQGDVLQLGGKANAFDTVFCYGVLISSNLPLRAALKEYWRVLKPGGTLYLCLNAMGWSRVLRDKRGAADPRVADMGREGLYNSCCQRTLTGVMAFLTSLSKTEWEEIRRLSRVRRLLLGVGVKDKLAPFAGLIRRVGLGLRRLAASAGILGETGNRDDDFEAQIAGWDLVCLEVGHVSGLLEALEFIRSECGARYVGLLAQDLQALALGRQRDFSFSTAGRGYEPDEVEGQLEAAGFQDFRWAPEGKLEESGERVPVSPIYEGRYLGQLTVWEAMARKPH